MYPYSENPTETRDFFAVPGVTSETALEEIAKRVWEERSRQELEGTVSTYEMAVPVWSGTTDVSKGAPTEVDLLSLGSGDVIRIEFDPEHMSTIAKMGALSDRIDHLESLGYSTQVATVLAENLADIAKLDHSFYVRTVEVEASDGEAPTFEVKIHFLNRIQIGADAQAEQPVSTKSAEDPQAFEKFMAEQGFKNTLDEQPDFVRNAFAELNR
jgi:hypothetical protein